MRHVYSETFALTGTTGAVASYVLSCNGMYDPNITGTGHQPLYFDQMNAIYDHYIVYRARIEYEILAGGSPPIVACYIDDDTSIATSLDNAIEQPTSVHRLLPTTQVVPQRFQRQWDARQYFGGDIWDNSELRGTASANPTEQSYFVVMLVAANGTSTATATVTVRIVYDAWWTELKTMTGS